MSTCSRCGALFGCAMADGGAHPCWCTALPAVLPLPAPGPGSGPAAACWCPACLKQHVASLAPEPAAARDDPISTD